MFLPHLLVALGLFEAVTIIWFEVYHSKSWYVCVLRRRGYIHDALLNLSELVFARCDKMFGAIRQKMAERNVWTVDDLAQCAADCKRESGHRNCAYKVNKEAMMDWKTYAEANCRVGKSKVKMVPFGKSASEGVGWKEGNGGGFHFASVLRTGGLSVDPSLSEDHAKLCKFVETYCPSKDDAASTLVRLRVTPCDDVGDTDFIDHNIARVGQDALSDPEARVCDSAAHAFVLAARQEAADAEVAAEAAAEAAAAARNGVDGNASKPTMNAALYAEFKNWKNAEGGRRQLAELNWLIAQADPSKVVSKGTARPIITARGRLAELIGTHGDAVVCSDAEIVAGLKKKPAGGARTEGTISTTLADSLGHNLEFVVIPRFLLTQPPPKRFPQATAALMGHLFPPGFRGTRIDNFVASQAWILDNPAERTIPEYGSLTLYVKMRGSTMSAYAAGEMPESDTPIFVHPLNKPAIFNTDPICTFSGALANFNLDVVPVQRDHPDRPITILQLLQHCCYPDFPTLSDARAAVDSPAPDILSDDDDPFL